MSRRFQTSVLDSAFPSLAIMGIVLLIALGLIAICGWKIFTLDLEREEISRERLLLERDRDAFLIYGSELPQITEKHRALSGEVALLEDRKQHLEQANTELTRKQEELGAKASRLTGAISELEAQLQTLESEFAKEKAAMLKLQPEQAALQKEVSLLKTQEAGLNASVAQKQKQETALIASLEGLERQRDHTQTLLGRMTEDKEMYGRLEKHIEQLNARFENILAKSDSLTGDYATRLERMEKLMSRLDHGMDVLDADRQALSVNLEALKKDHASYASFLKQNNDQNRSLQTQVELLAANNKKFSSAMESVNALDGKLQNALAAETSTLKKIAQEEAQTRASLASASETLAQNAQSLKGQIEQSQEAASRVSDMLAKQREQLEKIQSLTSELDASVEKNRQTAQSELEAGARLIHTAQALATQTDIFKTRLDLAGSQGSQLEKLMESQTARLKELGTLARQLSDDINENRRRGARLDVMLGEIQTSLAPPTKETVLPDTGSDNGATP